MARGHTIRPGVLIAAIALVGGVVLVVFAWLGVREVLERRRDRSRFDTVIAEAAARNHISPHLVKAVIRKESDFNPTARGGHGEVGLMQITRGAATDWENANGRVLRNLNMALDPELNIEIGTWYLARALRRWKRYEDREVLALAEYNAGYGNMHKWAPEDPREPALENVEFASTRDYIAKVLVYRLEFEQEAAHHEQQSHENLRPGQPSSGR